MNKRTVDNLFFRINLLLWVGSSEYISVCNIQILNGMKKYSNTRFMKNILCEVSIIVKTVTGLFPVNLLPAGLFPAGLFSYDFSQIGIFPANFFSARSFPNQFFPCKAFCTTAFFRRSFHYKILNKEIN